MSTTDAELWVRALGAYRPRSTAWSLLNDNEVDLVWAKGCPIPGSDPTLFRQDCYGREIWRSHYGQATLYGWEIDHMIPKARGGSDSIENLQPLHWELNREKSDKIDPFVLALLGAQR